MAACRLASKGKTLADSSFSSEVQSIQSFLAMQRTTPGNKTAQSDESINTHSLVSPRYQKKYKPKQVTPHGHLLIFDQTCTTVFLYHWLALVLPRPHPHQCVLTLLWSYCFVFPAFVCGIQSLVCVPLGHCSTFSHLGSFFFYFKKAVLLVGTFFADIPHYEM